MIAGVPRHRAAKERIATDPALRFGAPLCTGPDVVIDQVRRVLETRPGMLPWRPDYGCNLAGLLGRVGAMSLLAEAQFEVERAVCRWIPGVKVRRCVVRFGGGSDGAGALPTAERALSRGGVQAGLEIEIELDTALGRIPITASVRP